MSILAVGCSFLCARGTIQPQVSIIAERLNLPLDNKSIPGNGNIHIVYNTMNAMIENPKKYKLVLIGWSNPSRWDFVTAPDKWFAIKMNNVISTATNKRINFEDTLFRHWAPQVLLLANWLRCQNMPFIMWNSLKTWTEGESLFHKSIEETTEFYRPTTCHIDELREKQEYISQDDHHPNQKSHLDLGINIVDFYKNLYQ